MLRPSHKELSNKLRKARKATEQNQISVVEQLAIAVDAIALGYDVQDELQAVLAGLLEQTTPDHYTGTHPPQRSYEQVIEGLELFAFVAESDRFKRRIYFKFALADDVLWLASLHEDRPAKEEAS
jgi:hypothetical protein